MPTLADNEDASDGQPRFSRSRPIITDPETAFSMAARETDALANMMGADSRRIDSLVQDVGAILGDVHAVKSEVVNVSKGVDSLRDAMAVLVRHEVVMTQHATAVENVRGDLKDQDDRLHALERKAPGWDETRTWVVRAGLLVFSAVGLAVMALVLHKP